MIFDRSKRKKELIDEKIDAIKKDAALNRRYCLFDAEFARKMFALADNADGYKAAFNFIKQADNMCDLPIDAGAMIDREANNNMVFVTRTSLGFDPSTEGVPYSDTLKDILQNGFINHGHLNSGGGSAFDEKTPDLGITTIHLRGLSGYRDLFTQWHNSDTVVFMKFPENLITEDGMPTRDYSDIYSELGQTPRVRPEYMMGALFKKADGNWEYYGKDFILSEMAKKENKTM